MRRHETEAIAFATERVDSYSLADCNIPDADATIFRVRYKYHQIMLSMKKTERYIGGDTLLAFLEEYQLINLSTSHALVSLIRQSLT